MTDTFEFKVVVSGPFGVGKTSFISNISSVPVVGTEVPTSEDEAELKDTTTVGLEYGQFDVATPEFDIRLLLYGTPGQSRFRFMWEVLVVGADVCIVLVDVTRPSTWTEVAEMLEFFGRQSISVCAIGANRSAAAPEGWKRLDEFLQLGDRVPIIPCDITDQRSARDLLITVLEHMLSQHEPELSDELDHHDGIHHHVVGAGSTSRGD